MTILENVSLRDRTTFSVGGQARFLVEVHDETELKDAVAYAKEKGLAYLPLGGGSNVLVSDDGYDGLIIVIHMKGIERVDDPDGRHARLFVSAGEDWDSFVAYAVKESLWGVENLSGIPGTVGASPVQNIGAYGSEVKDTIESVRAYDCENECIVELSNAECEFGYRTSIWKRERVHPLIVTRVTYRLSRRATPKLSYKDLALYFEREGVLNPSLEHIRSAVLEIRAGKFPDLSAVGTAGSFWKNPTVSQIVYRELVLRYPGLPSFPAHDGAVKLPLAWILDRVCNLRGHTHGRAALYENQPLVLIAFPGCTSFEIESLVSHVSSLVHHTTGIVIEREVVNIG